jgi:hypothetical protein
LRLQSGLGLRLPAQVLDSELRDAPKAAHYPQQVTLITLEPTHGDGASYQFAATHLQRYRGPSRCVQFGVFGPQPIFALLLAASL